MKKRKITLTDEQLDALQKMRRKYRKTDWKRKLMDLWRTGEDVNYLPDDAGCYLRQIRNHVGPSGLDQLEIKDNG